MYRLLNITSVAEGFHFVVSNLLHRGGWTFIDARLNGVQAGTWDLPTDPVPPTLADGDFIVLLPPDAGLAACGDAIQFVYDAGGSQIDINVYRLTGGTGTAWDTVGNAPDGSAVTLADSIDIAAAQRLLLFSDQQSAVITASAAAGTTILDGAAVGYMNTLVSRTDGAGTGLGVGEDPFPVCILGMDSDSGGPLPSAFTNFGIGSCFDENDAVRVIRVNHIFQQDQGLASAELASAPINYGGGVSIHTLVRLICYQFDGTTLEGTRGVFPSVFLTSRSVKEAVLRVAADATEYLVAGEYVAVGPL